MTVAASTPASPPAVASPPAASATKLANVKILSHKVKGHVATIVVQVPAAGKLALSGKGVKALSSKPTKAERVTLRVPLTKASTASLHKHPRRHMKVKLSVSFRALSGASSKATSTLVFG